MRSLKRKMTAALAALAFVVGAGLASESETRAAQQTNRAQLEKKVRKELVTLPYFGVFDNLAYEVDGSTVTLHGQVVRPSTRKDAERRVARLAGVERVVNRIEVLPVSSFDDRIRVATYRAIARTGGMFRYFQGANPSVHIVVNRGHVSLEGVVSSEMDRRLAEIAARGVAGSFSVTNNLRAERGGRRF
ncbi:MAG TPA: BON domain-containing protein [Pyrinomonadaceae bacterium]|nr:BON domain-containing protein [Pyrinomonadaceae bacterium]